MYIVGSDIAFPYVSAEEPLYQQPAREVTEIDKGFDTSELLTSADEASARFQLDSAVAEYAEILRDSYWALDGSLKDVRALTQRVSSMLPDDPDVTEFAELVTRAMQIEEGDVS